MKYLWRGVGAVVVLSLTGGVACSQSFDCKKAATNTEHLVCIDKTLGELDEALANALRGALAAQPDQRARLLSEERHWIVQRDNTCSATAGRAPAEIAQCLAAQYHKRITELGTAGSPSPRSSQGDEFVDVTLHEFAANPGLKEKELLGLLHDEARGDGEAYAALTPDLYVVTVDGNTCRDNGLYLVDLSTLRASPMLDGALKFTGEVGDLAGHRYRVVEADWSCRDGEGHRYSAIGIYRTERNLFFVDAVELGDWLEADSDPDSPDPQDNKRCDDQNAAEAPRYISADLHIGAARAPGANDLVVDLTGIECSSGKTIPETRRYVPSQHGFDLQGFDASKLAEHLLEAWNEHKAELSQSAYKLREALEKAGVRRALYERPGAMSEADYVSVLRDYALTLDDAWQIDRALTLSILDRLNHLSGQRGDIYTARAGVLLQTLKWPVRTQSQKLSLARQIMDDYQRGLQLGANHVPILDGFLAFNLARYPTGTSVCDFFARLSKELASPVGGYRIQEVSLRGLRQDVENKGITERIRLLPSKYGYEVYGGIQVIESDGRVRTLPDSVSKEGAELFGFRLAMFEGKTYKVYETGYVTMIEGDNEKLVCKGHPPVR